MQKATETYKITYKTSRHLYTKIDFVNLIT